MTQIRNTRIFIFLLLFIPQMILAQTNKDSLKKFRYERYEGNKSAVYCAWKEQEGHNSAYYRKYGDNQGINFYTDNAIISELETILSKEDFSKYPQCPLNQEDTMRDRWMMEVEYESGKNIQIINYLNTSESDENIRISLIFDNLFNEEINKFNKQDVKLGEYTVTTYDSSGKKIQSTRYTADNIACGTDNQ